MLRSESPGAVWGLRAGIPVSARPALTASRCQSLTCTPPPPPPTTARSVL